MIEPVRWQKHALLKDIMFWSEISLRFAGVIIGLFFGPCLVTPPCDPARDKGDAANPHKCESDSHWGELGKRRGFFAEERQSYDQQARNDEKSPNAGAALAVGYGRFGVGASKHHFAGISFRDLFVSYGIDGVLVAWFFRANGLA